MTHSHSTSLVIGRDRVYLGIFHHDVIPLTDPNWKAFWGQYMRLKRIHEKNARSRTITGGFSPKEEAQKIKKRPDFDTYFDNKGKINKAKIKALINYELYPDLTKDLNIM